VVKEETNIMTIFRHRKSGILYSIARVSPPKHTGSWHEATPYFQNQGKTIKNAKLKDFVVIADA
jgi:kynurenine formamidase